MPTALSTRGAASTLATLSAAAAFACGNPLAPENLAGTCALQRVGDDPLPTILFANEYRRVRVLADTIRLSADGTGLQISIWESEPVEGDQTTERSETELRFDTDGGRIEIAWVCPPLANCVPPPHLVARPVGQGLRVDFASGRRVPLVYAPVAGSD